MSKTKLICTFLWIYIFCPIWSFIVNFLYWTFHIFHFKKAIKEKSNLKSKTINIRNIQSIMTDFEWKRDSLKDWAPWVITILDRNLQDDCDGAAVLGKFLLKSINIKSKIYHLVGKKGGHAVCISNDKKILISNNQVSYIIKNKAFNENYISKIMRDKWKIEVLKKFNYKYSKII